MSNFKICTTCDFEWHAADGETCPVCNKEEEVKEYSGVFGTSKNQTRINLWYKALGLVALVYLVIYCFLILSNLTIRWLKKYICEILKEDIIYF